MKKTFPPIDGSILEGISQTLGDTNAGLTGTEIGRFLQEVNIVDTDPGVTKWKRLFNAFVTFQNQNQLSNNILTFISKSISPARFIGKEEKFQDIRFELNKRLSFIGLEFTERGTFVNAQVTTTISEAEERANKLKYKLQQRNTHSAIYQFCRAELLAQNYFHTVFEATKSVAETIRIKASLTGDGADLVEAAFAVRSPRLKINPLATETELSEQKGFANLIKGVFGMFRNTTAHAPRLIWEINEHDALDILSTISLIHRKLENASVV